MAKPKKAQSEVKIHATEIEMWELDKVIPYPDNAKLHDERQVSLLAKNFIESGFHGVVEVDENGVILAGHGRRLAAIKAGMKELPVVVTKGLSEVEKRMRRIKDNSFSNTETDQVLIAKDIDFIRESMPDLNLDDFMFDDNQLELININVDSMFPDDFDDIGDLPDTKPSTKQEKSTAEDETPYKHSRVHDENGYKAKYALIVNCKSESDQEKFYDLANELGLDKPNLLNA